MPKKKAQITIYLILGMVLLLSIGLIFYVNNTQKKVISITSKSVLVEPSTSGESEPTITTPAPITGGFAVPVSEEEKRFCPAGYIPVSECPDDFISPEESKCVEEVSYSTSYRCLSNNVLCKRTCFNGCNSDATCRAE